MFKFLGITNIFLATFQVRAFGGANDTNHLSQVEVRHERKIVLIGFHKSSEKPRKKKRPAPRKETRVSKL